MSPSSGSNLAPIHALALVLIVGCAPNVDDSTSCGRARGLLGECGVILPLLEDDTCTGSTELIAECINLAGSSCDALAALGTHLEQCASTDGGSPLPTDFPQVNAGDAALAGDTLDAAVVDAIVPIDALADTGSHDAKVWLDASSSDGSKGGKDAAAAVDAGHASDAAAHDGGNAADVVDATSSNDAGIPTDAVFDATGVVAAGSSQLFATTRLGVGNYLFTATFTGSVNVYVRKGYAPTVSTYDCMISDPAETCLESIGSSAVLHVLVAGVATSSMFNVVAEPD